MGSQFNFRGFVNDPNEGSGGRGGGGRPPPPPQPGSFPLARQGSIYSLTFDEFQNTRGSFGKDFGSMNMDELLKNIWSAEEVQSTVSPTGTGNNPQDIVGIGGSSAFLQRQGSLTLPRTLSQKTVDEVWRDMSKGFGGNGNGNGKDGDVIAYSNMPQREPTLGEVTLEEFLVRAGVVREEARIVANANASVNAIMNDYSRDQALGFGFQQPGTNSGLMNGRMMDNANQIGMESPTLPVNVNGGRSSSQRQANQTQLFPKQPVLPYGGPPVGIPTAAQLSSPRIRDMVHNGSVLGMVNGGVTVAAASPAVSSDGIGKSNGDTSSLSPIPYAFNGGLRGRKGGPLEKVVERRQRRMIKNRESAARSRARKQAYTMELEAEVAKLKEENQELLKKQAEIMEMQKNQVMEMMDMQRGAKRRCLRRTQTSPW